MADFNCTRIESVFFLFLFSQLLECVVAKETDLFLTNCLQVVQHSISWKLTFIYFRWAVYIMLCQHCVTLFCAAFRWVDFSLVSQHISLQQMFILNLFLIIFWAINMFWENSLQHITNRSTMSSLSYIYHISWTFLSPRKTLFGLQISFTALKGCCCCLPLNYTYQIVQLNRGCKSLKCCYWINAVQL